MQLIDLLKLLGRTFDFFLILDGGERIIFANVFFATECDCPESEIVGRTLDELLQIVHDARWKVRVDALRNAMIEGRKGRLVSLVFSPKNDTVNAIRITNGYHKTADGELHVFHGTRISVSRYAEWEKEEHIKELSCLYSMTDWIEKSTSIKEFFTYLPQYFAPGMRYPEDVVVYSSYHGIEYGKHVDIERFIKTDLEVGGQMRGEIRVGYVNDNHDILPEEQRMLDEIGRILSLALERKELKENLLAKRAEEEGFRRRLTELEHEIEARENELKQQHEKLATANAYLSRVNRDWEETKLRLETMFLAIPDRVALIDRKRNVVMSNRAKIEQGAKCYKTIFGSDQPCQDCRLMRIVNEKTPIALEIRHDDTYYEVHALPVFNADHEVEGIIEFYRDITLEKTYQQQLIQADKLASLGQLVSGIGHEINNPNQFIKGNIRIIEQALADMLPIVDEYYGVHPDLRIARLKYDFFREHIMTLVHDMAHGSERIKSIVEGLRGFARKDEGLLIDEVDVNTIVDAGARLCHNQVHKTADIEIALAPELPAVRGNAQKIEQVLVNLIMNASQSIPEGRRGRIDVSTRLDSDSVAIDIRDNGKGMSDRTVKKIFDPFFTTRRSKGGTGLGLAIVYGIVKEHGGSIEVSSKVDVGTTFTLKLPVRRQAAASLQVKSGENVQD
jgi:signal transduction histidine kinase/PAS domain-containing protein